MIVKEDGVEKKLICSDCKGDAVGESGLGGGLLYCYGRCMRTLARSECTIAPIETEAELQTLRQDPY